MERKVHHLRDEMRRTFTTYALIPVFVIFVICLALAFVAWNRNVLERNAASRAAAAEALTSIIENYAEAVDELAAACDMERLDADLALQTEFYGRLYHQVNITHDNADFYLLNERMRPLLSNRAELPGFLEVSRFVAWGVVEQMRHAPNVVALRFVARDGALWPATHLAVGRAVVRGGAIRGYLVFVIPQVYLVRAVSNPYVQFAIADRFDYAPIVTETEFSSAAVQKLRGELRADGYVSFDKQQVYVTSQEIMSGALKIYAITPIGDLVGQYKVVAAILFGVLVVLTLMVVVSVKRQAAAKTEVVDRLAEAFAAVQRGNLDLRLEIRTHNEFELIADAYNMMLDSLKKLMRDNRDHARETVISEIKQLESQFNPHFLFNTLENIKFMVRLDPPAAVKMIVALSALLRYSINNQIGEVTVEEEIAYTRHYLDIQKYRFSERLDFTFIVEDDAKSCIVPKLILQPIIENAIKYGAADGGKLWIDAEICIRGGELAVVIFNTGAAIESNILEEVRRTLAGKRNASQHTGLHNVNRRIALLYGVRYGLAIMSEAGMGTTVKMLLPVVRTRQPAEGREKECSK